MKNTPRFFAIEGIRSAGKHILAEGLELHFAGQGLDVVVTGEPSEGRLGGHLHKILDGKLPAPKTIFEFQRFCAEDQFEHIRRVIRPYSQLGNLVFSIRYWIWALAYGMLDGSVEQYLKLYRDVVGSEMIRPDLTLLLDLEIEEALQRIIEKAERDFDRFAKFLELYLLRANYLELAKRTDLGKIIVINADQDKQKVLEDAIAAIEPFLV